MYSYEAHYGSFHRNICLECHRSFPSNFLLDLHILENHDVLFKLMSNAKYTVGNYLKLAYLYRFTYTWIGVY
jgi:hypothetical protein